MIIEKVPKTLFLSFLYFLLPINSPAQHEQLIDSLENLTSFERRRVVFGYLESASDLLNQKGERAIFMEQVNRWATLKKDKDLVKELRFIKRKQTAVMNFPRENRENKCLEHIESHKNSDDLFFLAFCHHELGQILFQNQNYEQAFEHDLKALEIYEKIGFQNVPNIGKILHEIALHYYFFRDYQEVVKLMKISIEFPPFSKGLDMQRYNNLGMSYMKMGKNDSAANFFNEGISVAKRYKSEIWEGMFFGNLGELYYIEKEYDSSLAYFRKNYIYNKDEAKHITVKINSHVNMAKALLALDSVQKAYNFLKIAEDTFSYLELNPSYVGAKHVGDRQQIEIAKRQYLEAQINYLVRTGHFQIAIQYQDSLLKIRKEIERKYNSAVGKVASKKIMIRDKELQLAQKEQEKTKERLTYIGLLLVIIISGGSGYLYMYKVKRKRKRQVERLITTNRISILEKQQTQKDLEIAQEEIDHFLSKFNEQNEIIFKFENDLKRLQGLKENQQIQIRETLDKMKKVKILTDDDWINFQNNFDTVFSGFKVLLKQKIPTITASEMRYLMLSKLHFSHKEMARALGISDAAIRVTWNKIRKKFNGTLDDTPSDLIERVKQANKESVMKINEVVEY